jgi:plasmid stabilization system protein ParE
VGRIRWTHEAAQWLQEIHDHIAKDNPDAAVRTVRGIFDKAQTLKEFPERGARLLSRPQRHIRILLYGHYRIVYLVKENRDVEILGVFHGALDIERYLA